MSIENDDLNVLVKLVIMYGPNDWYKGSECRLSSESVKRWERELLIEGKSNWQPPSLKIRVAISRLSVPYPCG